MTKVSKKQEILAAAEELFRERGYVATSMADIAAKVGLLKGSLYAHFPSKEDLLLQIVERPMNKVIERLLKVKNSGLPWPEKIRQAILAQFEQEDVPHFAATFMAVSELYTKARRDKNRVLLAAFRRHKEAWISLLQEGIEQSYSDGTISAKLAYFALVGMSQWTYKWYSESGPLTSEEIGEQFARLFLEGFARGSWRNMPEREP